MVKKYGIWHKWGAEENWIYSGRTSKPLQYDTEDEAKAQMKCLRQRIHGIWNIGELPEELHV